MEKSYPVNVIKTDLICSSNFCCVYDNDGKHKDAIMKYMAATATSPVSYIYECPQCGDKEITNQIYPLITYQPII